ncbi:MAG: flagellar motor switch protein FliM [Deltaproteobacteria bacterium]|nr:flagellar motor switch protein FliM [Deltaproteobacteria bacterium]
MPDQILSQEEIDALLGAMAEGEVDVEAEKADTAEAKPYDLTSQSIMLREQFFALEEVNDKLAGSLHNSLSSSLQAPIDVNFVSMEMIKFSDFLRAFASPTSYNIFAMEPLIGSSLLVVESDLAFSLIDCMFGGDGKGLSQIRDFTLIEQRMIRKFSNEVLKSMEKAWEIVNPIKTSLLKTETKSEFVHLVDPNEMVIAIVFSINGKEFSGNIHFCISYIMLEPIKDRLSSSFLRNKDVKHAWSSQLQALLKNTEVNLAAEVGSTMYTIRELLSLQVRDVLKLDSGPQDPITICVEGVAKYEGLPGISKGNRAVQIVTLLPKNGG